MFESKTDKRKERIQAHYPMMRSLFYHPPPLEENVSNSNDYSQSEIMNEGCISDTDFSFEDKLPVISDKGELLSSSFSFPSASVSPPPAREEESNEDVSADGQT